MGGRVSGCDQRRTVGPAREQWADGVGGCRGAAYGRQRWVGVVCFRVFRLAFALQGSQRVPGVDVSGELTFTLAGPSDIDLTSH